MQKGIGRQAGTPDIPGIPMDFRGDQDNMALLPVAVVMRAAFTQLGETASSFKDERHRLW